jgi:outer membrane protein OmpA-like peptidoglycan-associated protein
LRKTHRIEESSTKAPAYIVTFSTLAALLLAFFVVLVGMGTTQDETLFDRGYKGGFMGPFKRGFGVRQKFDFGNLGNRYGISEPDDSFEGRTTDANTEKLRRIVKKLSQSMKVRPSPIVAKKIDFSVTNIHFLPGDAVLNEPAKKFLTGFCLNLQQSSVSKAVRLYVLGLAGDVGTEKKQWIVSARRAQAAAEFLRDTLPEGTKSAVYSWGAGAGGDWVSKDSPISDQSQILIALLRDSD